MGRTLLNKENINAPSQQTKLTQTKVKISDILRGQGDKECTYSVEAGENKTVGKIYFSGKNIFHTAQIKNSDADQTTNYILKSDWLYSWGDNIPAMKMNMGEIQKMREGLSTDMNDENNGNEEKTNYKELGLNQDTEMECGSWDVDETKFNPPLNMEFKDVTQTMMDFTKQFKQTTEKVDNITNNMCAACNMTPDEETKKECLASLGCN